MYRSRSAARSLCSGSGNNRLRYAVTLLLNLLSVVDVVVGNFVILIFLAFVVCPVFLSRYL